MKEFAKVYRILKNVFLYATSSVQLVGTSQRYCIFENFSISSLGKVIKVISSK